MVTPRCGFALSVLMLGACSSPEDERLEQIDSELSTIEARENECFAARRSSADIMGQAALNEWDIAAADSVETISAEQEWEIRKSLGKEMNLAPSEVNGWREIYRSRAEKAKRELDRQKAAKAAASTRVEAACKSSSQDIRTKIKLERERRKLRGY